MSLCHHKQTTIPPTALMTGYEMKTTFWTDFNIADRFGKTAIEDTYQRAFNEWKNDKIYATELCMVLNWKSWEHSDNCLADEIGRLYIELYYKFRKYILDHWKGEKLTYFLETTD